MFYGETILSGAPKVCSDCGTKLKFEVLKSGGGYYVGTQCECGPYSRESCYFNTKEEAAKALKDINEKGYYSQYARNTDYNG